MTVTIAAQTAHSTYIEVRSASAVTVAGEIYIPSQGQDLKGLLMVAHLLLLRAAVVPSRAWWTALLGHVTHRRLAGAPLLRGRTQP